MAEISDGNLHHLTGHYQLMLLLEKETDLFATTESKHINSIKKKDIKAIRDASERMYQASCKLSDTIARKYYHHYKNEFFINSSIPKVVHKCLSAWDSAFGYLLGAANKTYTTWRHIADGEFALIPPEVQGWLMKSANQKNIAIKEMFSIYKKLGLQADQILDMQMKAKEEVESEEWYPYL